MATDELRKANDETRSAWEANAQNWDERMGDNGNDFFNVLCWPVIAAMLEPVAGMRLLDVACGNGLAARRLADLGVIVTAFDFSCCIAWASPGGECFFSPIRCMR